MPGAGNKPPALVGREDIIESARMLFVRAKAKRNSKHIIISGLRGVGKTALLNHLKAVAGSAGCHAIKLEADPDRNILADIVRELRSLLLGLDPSGDEKGLLRRALSAVHNFSISVGLKGMSLAVNFTPVHGIADSGNMDSDLLDLFASAGEASDEYGRGIALLIDELQYVDDATLKALIYTLHHIQQEQLPVAFVGAGLRSIYGKLGKAKTYAERMFEFHELGPLTRDEAFAAIRIPFEQEGEAIDDAALEVIYRQTQGYPYYLQEWGYHTWIVADASPASSSDALEASKLALLTLDSGFFKVRTEKLSRREQEFLVAMAGMPSLPCRTSDISTALGKKSTSDISQLRNRLISSGVIYDPKYGELEFTVPLFGQYVLRTMAGS
ncbi:MAG: ATP-binding protein [Mailhella sp.]|nr:ATP-binding protein [Mailhella sp.]